MEIKTNCKELHDCLVLVKDAASPNNINSALSNVLVRVKGGNLTMVATNHEIQMTAQYPLKSAKEVEQVLPVAKLLKILGVLNQEADVKIKFGEDSASISAGRSNFKLTVDKVNSFVPLGETGKMSPLETIGVKEMKAAFRKVSYASAQQSHRMNLNGVYMERLADGIHLTATDGHRLATQLIGEKKKKDGKETQHILPRKTVDILQQRLGDEDELEISANDRAVKFKTGQFELITNVIDENYPDYPSVIPRNNENKALIERKALQEVMRRVQALAEKQTPVNFAFSDNRLDIECLNRDNDSLTEWLEINYSQEKLQIGFDISFVLDVLNALDTDMVEVSMADNNSSALIKGVGDEAFSYVLMPIHT